MIIVFQSQAAGDVIMFGDVAQRMMAIMGKDVADQGIITVDQLPDAINRLRAAIAADKAERAGKTDDDLPKKERAEDGSSRPFVNLMQRAVPLVELLELSLKKNKPVVWGV